MSKIISRFLSVLLSVFLLSALVIPCAVSAAEPEFYAVGSPEFFEWGWSAGDSRALMTKGGDGKYSITMNASGAQNAVNMKVVEDNGSGQIWHGDGESNVVFDVKGAGTIIITYDPATGKISVSGTAYAAPVLQYSTVAVAGNGEGNFLHGESWNEKSTANMMTQVSPTSGRSNSRTFPQRTTGRSISSSTAPGTSTSAARSPRTALRQTHISTAATSLSTRRRSPISNSASTSQTSISRRAAAPSSPSRSPLIRATRRTRST